MDYSTQFRSGLDALRESPLSLSVRILLAGVFVTAGASKLYSAHASSVALTNLNVIRRARPAAGLLLGVAELTTAALVILMPSGAIGPTMALILCLGFTVVLTQVLRSGRIVSCGCFVGRDEPIDIYSLLRSLLLSILAVVAILAPVASEFRLKTVAQAGVVATCTAALMSLLTALARTSRVWAVFLDDHVDWALAAEINQLPSPTTEGSN